MNELKERLVIKRDNTQLSMGKVCCGWKTTVGNKTKIKKLSKVSTWRMVGYLKSCTANYTAMITMTYPANYPTDGVETKKHLDRFLKKMMKTQTSILWFLEFQKRGAPHYHLFITDYVGKYEVSMEWAAATNCFHGIKTMTRIERLRRGKDGLISYAVKYSAKSEQKDVPDGFSNVGRFWGVRGVRDTLGAVTKMDVCSQTEAVQREIDSVLDQAVFDGQIKKTSWSQGIGHFYAPVQRTERWFSLDVAKKVEQLIRMFHLSAGTSDEVGHISNPLSFTELETFDSMVDMDND